ncbi:hypothetical protein BC941DRAFT_443903 [Chlamydoabsidia padenii]|nr:hypothetical protein BC941DRAFT_443903 [Chlamydoabsidia padenii]
MLSLPVAPCPTITFLSSAPCIAGVSDCANNRNQVSKITYNDKKIVSHSLITCNKRRSLSWSILKS